MTSPITTHVLDTARGVPAAGVPVILAFESAPGTWTREGHGTTDSDGRLRTLLPAAPPRAGTYRLTFDVGSYFGAQNVTTFWSSIVIEFVVSDTTRHFHVPLLVSPFGYSTYRGS